MLRLNTSVMCVRAWAGEDPDLAHVLEVIQIRLRLRPLAGLVEYLRHEHRHKDEHEP